jgi:hypothetical protein
MFRPLTTGRIESMNRAFAHRPERQQMEWRLHMINQPPGKFDPDYVATLRKILDIAVENIAIENRTPATKAKMAQVIVQEAAGGITDARDLVSRAVRVGETRAA